MTQLLLDHGVAVDMRTQDTHDSPTALHASLDMGLVCVSLFLLMAGADPASVDKSGNTPFFTIARQLLQVCFCQRQLMLLLCLYFHDTKFLVQPLDSFTHTLVC